MILRLRFLIVAEVNYLAEVHNASNKLLTSIKTQLKV